MPKNNAPCGRSPDTGRNGWVHHFLGRKPPQYRPGGWRVNCLAKHMQFGLSRLDSARASHRPAMLVPGLSMARPLDYCVGRRTSALFKAPAVPAGVFSFAVRDGHRTQILDIAPLANGANPIDLVPLPKSLVALGVRGVSFGSVSYTNRFGVIRVKPKTGAGFGCATRVAWCVTDFQGVRGCPAGGGGVRTLNAAASGVALEQAAIGRRPGRWSASASGPSGCGQPLRGPCGQGMDNAGQPNGCPKRCPPLAHT